MQFREANKYINWIVKFLRLVQVKNFIWSGVYYSSSQIFLINRKFCFYFYLFLRRDVTRANHPHAFRGQK